MNIGRRIRDRRKQLKLTVDQVAEKLGKNRATIYRYESNEIENMPIETLEPLAEVLNVTPAYLMGWEQQGDNQLASEYRFYPVSISAGQPLEVNGITNGDVEKITLPDSLMGKWAGSSEIYMMRVNGDSMNKVIPHGSLIAIKSVDLSQLKDGDIVVYSDCHEYSMKRIYNLDDKMIFRPDSSDKRFTDNIVSKNNHNLKIHGKVVVYIVELD